MDVTKVKAAIATAQAEIRKIVEGANAKKLSEVTRAELGGLHKLASADRILAKADKKLDDAAKVAAPKAKKETKKEKK